MAAFYEPDGAGYLATELTRGPWDPGAQHAGPPAALLGRELELLPEAEDFQICRVTFEILRQIPIGRVEVEARIVRPGRRVQMLEAELRVEGEVLMMARAWRLRTASVDLPAEAVAIPPGPALPSEPGPSTFLPSGHDVGYHTAMELRFTSGAFTELGPGTAWLRMRVPLVDEEKPSPLQRVLIAADVGNGISAAVDFRRFVFVNVDLTVQLERLPEGEWVCVDAVTLPRERGNATAESVLSDETGRLGRACRRSSSPPAERQPVTSRVSSQLSRTIPDNCELTSRRGGLSGRQHWWLPKSCVQTAAPSLPSIGPIRTPMPISR